ncbi:MAG: DNA alkylation repair protein [Deltaproteobacteria bacterium]|nr:DNA alkylation repair protein [Deltaproteobacteria bacterium]MBW2182011.1 DNA alkylation repair protein [Deltaproteobacteria bacterium]
MSVETIQAKLKKLSSKEKAKILQRFFKTGPGEYGEGDIFIGVKVPELRQVAKEYIDISLKECGRLLSSKIHEERMLALLILIKKFTSGNETVKKRIYQFYIRKTKYINNWDLVDLSAPHIAGAYLINRSKKELHALAKSKNLWERRIAIISTFKFIKSNQFSETIKISKTLLADKEDLMHKAVGWMLREIGKRDLKAEEAFLKEHYKTMPRTMLRYAIEKFPETKRQKYLKGKI